MPKTYPEPLEKEEMDALLDAALEDEHCYILFYVARYTGRRLGEYYNVKLKDIDFENNVMMTLVLKRKKHIEKEAILFPHVSAKLHRYCKEQRFKLDDYVFRYHSYRTIQNKIKKYAKIAGITKNVMFHNFRHYFITTAVKNGMTYERIAKLTGHGSPGTLVHYDHTVARDVRDEVLSIQDNF